MVLVSVLGTGAGIFAQDAGPGPGMLVVTEIKVNPGMEQAFEEMVKAKITPAAKRGGATDFTMWKASFGPGMTYYAVVSLPSFAALDGPNPIARGLGDEGPEVFRKMSPMLADVSSAIYREQPKLSHTGKMTGPPNVAVLIGITVDPDMDNEFEAFVEKEVIPVMRKTDVAGFWTSRLVFGGNTNEYVIVELQPNFAALDKGPPFLQVMKPEEVEKMFDKLPKGTVETVRVDLMKYLPELSFTAQQ